MDTSSAYLTFIHGSPFRENIQIFYPAIQASRDKSRLWGTWSLCNWGWGSFLIRINAKFLIQNQLKGLWMDNASEAPWSIMSLISCSVFLYKGNWFIPNEMRFLGQYIMTKIKYPTHWNWKKFFFPSTLLHFMSEALQIKLAKNRLTKYKQTVY